MNKVLDNLYFKYKNRTLNIQTYVLIIPDLLPRDALVYIMDYKISSTFFNRHSLTT